MAEQKKPTLQEELARIENIRGEYLNRLEDAGASDEQIARQTEMFNKKRKEVLQEYSKGSSDFLKDISEGGRTKHLVSRTKKELSPELLERLRINQKTIGKLRSDIGPKIGNLLKSGRRGLKAVPLIGPMAAAGLTALIDSPEAAASEAVTDLVPGGVEDVGPKKGSLGAIIEDPTASEEEKRRAIELLTRKNAVKSKSQE